MGKLTALYNESDSLQKKDHDIVEEVKKRMEEEHFDESEIEQITKSPFFSSKQKDQSNEQ